MELKHYLQIAVRWAWLLILGAALGAAGGYYYSKGQQPVYQASTRAMLMRAPLEQSSDLTYYSDLQLVQTYLQLMTTQPVIDKASEQLGYKVSKGQIKVKQNHDTQILELTVEINRLEHEADLIRRGTLARLFREEKDVFELIKWKDIQEYMEKATDRCEDVANITEGIVLENT